MCFDPRGLTEIDYQKAGAEAERLAGLVKGADSLEPVFESLDGAILDLEANGDQPGDLLPADAEPGIGFFLNQKRDGRTLWEAIAIAGRVRICDPAGEVRKKLAQTGQAGSGALVSAVMIALGLPAIAIPIAVAIVSVILAIGVDGFCQWASSPADAPAES